MKWSQTGWVKIHQCSKTDLKATKTSELFFIRQDSKTWDLTLDGESGCWKRSLSVYLPSPPFGTKKITALSITTFPMLTMLQFKFLQSLCSLREFIPSPDYSAWLQLVAMMISFWWSLGCIYNPGAIHFRLYSQVWGRAKTNCKRVQ